MKGLPFITGVLNVSSSIMHIPYMINGLIPGEHRPHLVVHVMFEAVMFCLSKSVHIVRWQAGGELDTLVRIVKCTKACVKPKVLKL